MVYSIDEIKRRIAPVAARYHLRTVYLFGSYARGEATEASDIDLLVDLEGSGIDNLFDLGGLYNDLSECIGAELDMVTLDALTQDTDEPSLMFVQEVFRERVVVYA